MNTQIPKAVGMATARSLVSEYGTVVSVTSFVPTTNPPPPTTQVETRRHVKPHISAHPRDPNLLRNRDIM